MYNYLVNIYLAHIDMNKWINESINYLNPIIILITIFIIISVLVHDLFFTIKNSPAYTYPDIDTADVQSTISSSECITSRLLILITISYLL